MAPIPAWIWHQTSLIVFLLVILSIAVHNLWAWRRLSAYEPLGSSPALSVLIPARNEQRHIVECVRSVLAQDYDSLEVVVLDDVSSDATAAMVEQLAAEDPRLRLQRGEPVPAGWVGKNWACQQLASTATHPLLLFVDADTRLAPDACKRAVAALLSEGVGLVSVLPRQTVVSWAEVLAVPIMAWSVSSLLPLTLAYRWHTNALTTASGQFMLFRRDAYEAIGGHHAVRDRVVEDIALARKLGAAGLGWRLLDGQDRVRCRMYYGFQEVWDGFGKNLFALFDNRVLPFAFVWLWLLVVHWEPLLWLALALPHLPALAPHALRAVAALALTIAVWMLTVRRFALPWYLVLLYPVLMLFVAAIAARSMLISLAGRGTWKGRAVKAVPR